MELLTFIITIFYAHAQSKQSKKRKQQKKISDFETENKASLIISKNCLSLILAPESHNNNHQKN
jgi:hypothetical protein